MNVIDVINNKKKSTNLEKIVNFFVTQGDIGIKALFKQAVVSVEFEHDKNLVSENEEEFLSIFSKVSSNNVEQSSTKTETQLVEEQEESFVGNVDPKEERFKITLLKCNWISVKLPEEPYKIMDFPSSLLDRLWGALNSRYRKTDEEKELFSYLGEIKKHREDGPAKKVRGKANF